MQNYNEVSPTWVRMTITKNIQKSMLKMVWRKGNPVALLVGLQISVQLLGCVQLFVTLWTAAHQASLSITNSRSLLKLMSIESMMPSNRLSSVFPFSSHLQSFKASRSFPKSQFSPSGGQSIGASASTSVLPGNIQEWFPLGWTGWLSLQSKGLSTTLATYKDILLPTGLVNPDLGLVRFKSH